MKRILTVLAAVVCLCGCEKFFTANVGLAYALDGVLDRTTDAYRRRNYPQFRLKFGVEF